ncbi:hypothetical protein [Mycetocola reblochoni]|uniref:Uncharacterized protein n=2 Tax=Mycetocola reblochoni TaxID=331618 RepID=A0A1R4IN79_9MICO|nr:hypothetical protein [Mycetocola reblochoni]RLP67900.1 hypothetical protein D9V30_12235 [Mycetocola reblochoni]SJN21317.1 hypothetical protein FM119_02725 [Mycetocola reblochoni REB411]
MRRTVGIGVIVLVIVAGVVFLVVRQGTIDADRERHVQTLDCTVVERGQSAGRGGPRGNWVDTVECGRLAVDRVDVHRIQPGLLHRVTVSGDGAAGALRHGSGWEPLGR